MSASLEVVMPNPEDRKSFLKGFPAGTRVVASPSDRRNVDRLLVAGLESFSSMSGLELLSALRARQKSTPVVFFVAHHGRNTAKEIILFQNLAIASSEPADPAFVAPDEETVERIVRAHVAHAEKLLIATARIEEDQLWVWSCEPKLYRCQISSLAPLRELSASQLENFVISKSGSRLHWAAEDVDMALDAVQAVADPLVRASQERQYRRAAKGYAGAIRALREKHGLAQSEVAGLSDRAVRRIEQGERIPHLATLEKLAKAHGMGVDDYMSALAKLSAPAGKKKRAAG